MDAGVLFGHLKDLSFYHLGWPLLSIGVTSMSRISAGCLGRGPRT